MKITNEQRERLIGVFQELQCRLEAQVREAQTRGNAQEILPKAIQIRKDYYGKIEAILSDTQKTQWEVMRGQPFDVFIDN